MGAHGGRAFSGAEGQGDREVDGAHCGGLALHTARVCRQTRRRPSLDSLGCVDAHAHAPLCLQERRRFRINHRTPLIQFNMKLK